MQINSQNTQQKKIILIDTFGFFFRSYYALPPLHNSKNFPTSLLTGFATLIFNIFKDNPHANIIFTLEGHDNKRKEIFPQYKANRKDTPQDLLLQLPVAISWLEKMGITTLKIEGYEADDCIATLSKIAQNKGFRVEIISHDKDLYQLINDQVHIFDYAKKSIITSHECEQKFGVLPSEFITYQSIVGDSSDNIPGIKGIGAKGAQKIVTHFKTLESLYKAVENNPKNVEEIVGKRTLSLIQEHKDSAFLSQKLVTLQQDLLQDFDFSVALNSFQKTPLLQITAELEEYELQKILQKIGKSLTNKKHNPENSLRQNTINTNLLQNQYIADMPQEMSFESPSTSNGFSFQSHLITESQELFEILESLPPHIPIAFDCETNGLNVREDNMVGFSFCYDGVNGYYVPFLHGGVKRDRSLNLTNNFMQDSQPNLWNLDSIQQENKTSHNVNFSLFPINTCDISNNKTPHHSLGNSQKTTNQTLLEDSYPPKQISQKDAKEAIKLIFTHPLIGHNLKFDLAMTWYNFGLLPTFKETYKNNINNTNFLHKIEIQDSMVLAWLLNPSQSVSLDNLMREFFNHEMISFESIVPKGATFDSIRLECAAKYASEDAVATYVLYQKLENLLEPHLLEVAKDLEFPFIYALRIMEDCGIAIHRDYFLELKNDFSARLHTLQQKIYKQSGYEFNINSPKQLSEILFDKLHLDATNNKSLSTNENALTNLIHQHEVIPTLLEYREAFKLFSTYIEPILKLSTNNHRIYTSFMQTGTNTGRLSSKSPNLQNIPVRSELGRSIRAGFVAEKTKVLLSLDYSQIELRLLAHFSQDSVLVKAFKHNADIHAETAKRIFKDKISICNNSNQNMKDSIDKDSQTFVDFRNIAKSINFGLIYGMGARKLAQTLNITQAEAKGYIEDYFANFPSVKEYLEQQKKEILKHGYSQTLLGRKRHFDFFSATEFMRSNYLREGVNTIFQGSAADLIKLSMNAIVEEFDLLKHNDVKMLLQVHDELIFEVKEECAKDIGEKIKDIMENIYMLRVPLVCNLAIGKTWADLK